MLKQPKKKLLQTKLNKSKDSKAGNFGYELIIPEHPPAPVAQRGVSQPPKTPAPKAPKVSPPSQSLLVPGGHNDNKSVPSSAQSLLVPGGHNDNKPVSSSAQQGGGGKKSVSPISVSPDGHKNEEGCTLFCCLRRGSRKDKKLRRDSLFGARPPSEAPWPEREVPDPVPSAPQPPVDSFEIDEGAFVRLGDGNEQDSSNRRISPFSCYYGKSG